MSTTAMCEELQREFREVYPEAVVYSGRIDGEVVYDVYKVPDGKLREASKKCRGKTGVRVIPHCKGHTEKYYADVVK